EAVHRTPVEIWWEILDETIYGEYPLFFSTAIQREDWVHYSHWNMPSSERDWLDGFERQRKIVGSVCRSWQDFSQSRRYRYVKVAITNDGALRGVENALTAYRIRLSRAYYRSLEHVIFEQEYNWLAVELDQPVASILARIRLPRLRRLHMTHYEPRKILNLNPLLDILATFPNLTWISYLSSSRRGESVPIDKNRSPVVLPHLQYLFIHVYELPSRVPLLDLLAYYCQTLRSFAARGFNRRGDKPVLQFLSWNDFPSLEELILDSQWTVHFQPLPSNHPLRRLDVKMGSFDVISSLLEGDNMRELILQRTRWMSNGGLMGETEDLMADRMAIDRILSHAVARDIKLKITWDGELEELVLDNKWTAYFQDLPFGHPLRRLDATYGSVDVLRSLIEGKDMRHVTLRRAHWRYDGSVARLYEEIIINKEEETINRIPGSGRAPILSRLCQKASSPKALSDQIQPSSQCNFLDRSNESAVDRAPIEIWWKILDEVIDAVLGWGANRAFATTFEGSYWVAYSHWWMLKYEDDGISGAQNQIKLIRSVCRSWAAFAQSRNDRDAILNLDFTEKQLHGIIKAPKAHRLGITAYCNKDIVRLEFDQGVGGEIIKLDRKEKYLDLNVFLDVLYGFTNLTWLDYEVDNSRRPPIPLNQGKPPVLLPNLQLPSRVPLMDVLSCYQKTLQSFVAGGFKDRGDVATIHFPPWNEFPKLAELVLDEQWIAYFEPLPRGHPLRLLTAQLGSLGPLSSLLDGENMIEIRLWRLKLTKEGGWCGRGDNTIIGNVEVEELWEKAQTRGIEFTVLEED
ncbi:4201_t:CDS:2, partial [Acaulospora colombiana]